MGNQIVQFISLPDLVHYVHTFFYKTVLYKNLKPHFDSSNWHEFQKVLMGILVGSNLKKVPDERHIFGIKSDKNG